MLRRNQCGRWVLTPRFAFSLWLGFATLLSACSIRRH